MEEAKKFDDAAANASFQKVFTEFFKLIPGGRWALTPEKAAALGMLELADT